jgi:MFS family permease
LIADSVPPTMRGRAFGVRSAADNAGALLGPLIAFALLTWFGLSLRSVFWWSAVPAGLAIVVAIVGVRDVAKREGQSSK